MPQKLEPTYRDALVKSWQFIIHHKMLWVLGAVAGLVGQFGLGNFIGSFWSFITEGQIVLLPILPRTISWHLFSTFEIWQFAALLVIMFAVLAFIVVAGTCAQGAVIAASAHYFSGRRTATLNSAWHTGARHFWRLLVINVIQQIILLAVLSALLGFWQYFSHTTVGGISMLVLGLTIGMVIAIVTSVLSIYTAAGVVIKEYNLSEAVGAGYELFKDHLVVSLEISCILLILTIVPILVIWLGTYVAIIPAIPFWWLGVFLHRLDIVVGGIFLAQLFFAIVVALVGGGFNAFTLASWMYTYRMMDKKGGVPSRVLHHVEKILVRQPRSRSRVVRGRVS